MSTDPTTKSQVQAYRFGLRRMESALVRKDAVMLHEPMRHHLRATAVGLIVGLLGLAAFFLIGRFHPTSGAGIVIENLTAGIAVLSTSQIARLPVRSYPY